MKCQTCNQEFTPKRSDSIYCSKPCKQKAYRAKLPSPEIIGNVTDTDNREIARQFIAECAERGIDASDWLLLVKLDEIQLILSQVSPIKRNTWIVKLIDWAWGKREDYDLSDCFDTKTTPSPFKGR
ncbi:MAG: hypothetical protein SFT94_06555 [Pseudanabaenaceae cyanobacterium bins.68]|nr:hypothetical protein [Pseudanabaenaceae cyanobacterium bins.68]